MRNRQNHVPDQNFWHERREQHRHSLGEGRGRFQPEIVLQPALQADVPSEQDAASVRDALSRSLPIGQQEVNVFPLGHAAGVAALAAGVDRILAGGVDACLVGGVDSYFHPDTMEWLDANRQLSGAVSRSGFVPGEGAGFLLLGKAAAGVAPRGKPLSVVRAVATAREAKLIKTTDMCLGEGLTATVRKAVTGMSLPAERINSVICDVNGERYRSEEWGFVCLRVSQYFDDPTAYQSPAERRLTYRSAGLHKRESRLDSSLRDCTSRFFPERAWRLILHEWACRREP